MVGLIINTFEDHVSGKSRIFCKINCKTAKHDIMIQMIYSDENRVSAMVRNRTQVWDAADRLIQNVLEWKNSSNFSHRNDVSSKAECDQHPSSMFEMRTGVLRKCLHKYLFLKNQLLI